MFKKKACQSKHLRGLKAFKEEHHEASLIIVSLDPSPRIFHDVEVMPATYFLQNLWKGTIYATPTMDGE